METKEHPIIQEIKDIDLNCLTPMEAMNTLYQLQMRLKNKS